MLIASKLSLFACALCAGSSLLGGCQTPPNLPPPTPGNRAAEAPHLETRTKYDRQTGKLLREWKVLVYSDRPAQKQGVENVFYPSGAKQWSREFDHGEPKGAWRSWYEDGEPRSESFFGDPSVDTIMTWWYPGGRIQSRGPARNGVHRGLWRFYYQNGQVAEEGSFIDNQKQGEWHAWSEDGKVVTRRQYAKGVRVSETPAPELAGVVSSPPNAAAPAPPVAGAVPAKLGKPVPSVPVPLPVDLPQFPEDPNAGERPPK